MGRNKKADILCAAWAQEACWKNYPKSPEENRHVCIFLQKFHSKLSFIEYFWYLWKNCDYTFETLKTNLPKALASVPLDSRHHTKMEEPDLADCSGLKLTTVAWMPKMHKCRSRHSVPNCILLTAGLQRGWGNSWIVFRVSSFPNKEVMCNYANSGNEIFEKMDIFLIPLTALFN